MHKSIFNIFDNLLFFNILIIISFITFKSTIYWYFIPVSIFTIFFLLYDTNNLQKLDCLKNNINDPYLNLTDSQYSKICKINTKKFFNFNLYTNYNDVFYNKNLERQFYTMPNIFNPPYNKDISLWLYNTIDNCKNNSDYCLPYYDTRFH